MSYANFCLFVLLVLLTVSWWSISLGLSSYCQHVFNSCSWFSFLCQVMLPMASPIFSTFQVMDYFLLFLSFYRDRMEPHNKWVLIEVPNSFSSFPFCLYIFYIPLPTTTLYPTSGSWALQCCWLSCHAAVHLHIGGALLAFPGFALDRLPQCQFSCN